MANRRNIDKLCSSTQDHRTFHFSVLFSKFFTTVNLYNGRANTKSLFLGQDFFWDTFRTSDAFTHWKKTLRRMDSSPLQTQRRGVTRENLRNQASWRKQRSKKAIKREDTIRITTLGSFKTLDFSWIHDCLKTYRFNKVWHTDLPWYRDKYWIW